MATKQSSMDTTDYAMTPTMTPASSTTNDPTLPRGPLPERPLPGCLSTSCQSQPCTLQYTDFPTEPPEGVHPMLWGMLKIIKDDVAQLQGVGDRLTSLEDQADKDGSDIAMIKLSVQQLTSANKTLAGRLMRAEATIEKQQATITDLKMRSMRDNIIIKTTGPVYKDIQDENTDCTIRRFLKDEMHIANVEDIRINSSHRMGQASANYNKMLIARLPCRSDQSKIFDNASALRGTNFSICKQFPPEVEERRQFAWADYKRAKTEKRAARFDGGSLVVGGERITKYDPMSLPPASNTLLGRFCHDVPRGASEVCVEDGHAFQAWAIPVHSLDEIREGLDQLLQVTQVAGATHIPYAFRISGADGAYENFNSDGDLGAGLSMMRILRDLSVNNVAVFVAHHSVGPLAKKKKMECLANVVNGATLALTTMKSTWEVPTAI